MLNLQFTFDYIFIVKLSNVFGQSKRTGGHRLD